jgi:hypothetical protein
MTCGIALMRQSINRASLDWMPKSVWGPIKWKELHYRGLVELPMEEEDEWFFAFREGLPCPKCRQHFDDFVKRNPPDFRSRKRFFAWTVTAHNHVNRALGKSTLTLRQARALHECRQ